jgi:hypothetical protein
MNLIVNGSFEIAASGYSRPTGNGESIANGDPAIAGWTVFGGLSGDGVAWLPNGNGYGPATPSGSDFLDLTGYHDQKPYFGVEQTIKTVVGDTYSLTFHVGVDNSVGLYSGPVSVVATAGSTTGDFTNKSKKTGNVWEGFSLKFTATSTSTLISIQGLSGDQYIGLDNVAVNLVKKPAGVSAPSVSASGFASAMASLDPGAGGAAHLPATFGGSAALAALSLASPTGT